jgi:hypothetical protein
MRTEPDPCTARLRIHLDRGPSRYSLREGSGPSLSDGVRDPTCRRRLHMSGSNEYSLGSRVEYRPLVGDVCVTKVQEMP